MLFARHMCNLRNSVCWSVTKLCLTLCDPMGYSMRGFSVLHYFLDFAQTHNSYPLSWWCHAIISSSVAPFLLLPSISPSIWVFSNELALCIRWPKPFAASASASVLPVNIQGWFPLGWIGLISLQSKGLSGVFSNTTDQKHQFINSAFFMV